MRLASSVFWFCIHRIKVDLGRFAFSIQCWFNVVGIGIIYIYIMQTIQKSKNIYCYNYALWYAPNKKKKKLKIYALLEKRKDIKHFTCKIKRGISQRYLQKGEHWAETMFIDLTLQEDLNCPCCSLQVNSNWMWLVDSTNWEPNVISF